METPKKPNVPEIINEPSTYVVCEYIAGIEYAKALSDFDPYFLDNLGAKFNRVEFTTVKNGGNHLSKIVLLRPEESKATTYEILLAEVDGRHEELPEITLESFSATPYSVLRTDKIGVGESKMSDTRLRLLNEALINALHAEKIEVIFSTPDNEIPIKVSP